jgi:LacI family transcriptional regulator
MTKRATMIDVARLAGVGVMTVSRVLNGSAHVSSEATSRVQAAIERLRYRPNEIARALRVAKSRSIGLIVPSLADAFFATCAHNINMVAQRHGYSMILTSSNDSINKEFLEAEWMLQKHVEGIIICPTPAKISKLSDPIFQRTPIVSFDRPLQVLQIASVLVDNGGGAKHGTQHLIEHGHKRIHFLGNAPNLFTIQRRFDGYRRALSNAGLKAQECLDCNSEELVLSYVKKVMDGKNTPSAFFCGNNQVSRYLYRALFHLQLQIPGDVAVVGFDDFDMADMLYPPLTVIRQPVDALGKTAAEVLFARLNINVDDWPKDTSRTTLNVELILRRSCGCKSASTANSVAIK